MDSDVLGVHPLKSSVRSLEKVEVLDGQPRRALSRGPCRLLGQGFRLKEWSSSTKQSKRTDWSLMMSAS